MRDHSGGVISLSIEPHLLHSERGHPGNSEQVQIRINISLLWSEAASWELAPMNISLLRSEEQSKSTKYKVRHSIDILNAAAVAHGAKIKESTVNELSK